MINHTDSAVEQPEPKKSILQEALERIEDRQEGYGDGKKENAFPFIRERWSLWLRQNLGPKLRYILRPDSMGPDRVIDWSNGEWEWIFRSLFSLSDKEVADLMKEFKAGRRAARKAAGKEPKRDDLVDEAGYLDWMGEL